MSIALKLEPRWPEPARLTATSAFARHMSASSARSSRGALELLARDQRQLPRMLPQHVLVHVGAPARAGGDRQRAVRDLGHRGRQLLAPGHVVDVDLEDAHVRDRGAPLGGDERGEVAVVVVRRAVDLERLGEVGDLLRLVEAVPDHVDRGDVHRAGFEERPEAAVRVEVLPGADRDRRAVAHARRARPGRTRRPRATSGRGPSSARATRSTPSAVRLKFRSTIGSALPPRSLAERVEQPHERVLELRRRVAVEAVALEAGHQHLRLVAGDDDVRLERLEAALDDLAAERRRRRRTRRASACSSPPTRGRASCRSATSRRRPSSRVGPPNSS